MNTPIEEYLGEGLHVSYDGFSFTIRTRRGQGIDDIISLDPGTLKALQEYIEKVCGVKITVTKVEEGKV